MDAPEAVVASYSKRRAEFLPADIGFARQRELFDQESDRLGAAPPVIDAEDVLRDPRSMVTSRAMAEISRHWDAVYEVCTRRCVARRSNQSRSRQSRRPGSLCGQRKRSRSTRRLREPSKHHEVGMKLDLLDSAYAERAE